MNMLFSKTLLIHLLIISFSLITITKAQSQCHLKRFPQVIPMLYGQEATINLQQYVTGSNITFTVQPNDFYANIQPQYTCKWLWNRQLGRIISTEYYEIKQNNKTQQLVAMLGGSSYFTDVYLVYYGINVSEFQASKQGKSQSYEGQMNEGNSEFMSKQPKFTEINPQNLNADNLQVLEVPRYKLKDCRNFNIISNNTHLQIILDCMSLANPLNKIFSTTIISINSPNPNPTWQHIESPIYLPKQIIPKLQNIRSQIAVIETSKTMRYLVRTLMSEYADYIEVWRWTEDGKEIIGLYDTGYFVDQDNFFGDDIDIRMIQVISNTILVLDLLNGLHIMRLNNLGQLLYRVNIEIESFTTFHYDPKQQLLFMGKQGQIQQYQIELLSQNNIKANRIQRYHLYDFEEITQIVTHNRFLYVSTAKYIHVIHLTNIPTNDQDYDGSYKIYPELYVQKLIPTSSGFIKVIGFQSNVQISICDTHPPFLHLKTPKMQTNFTVHAISTINQRSTQCSMVLMSMTVTADDDNIYMNGYEAENQTIFSNRPGTTIVDLDKYGIGKNIDYDLVTFNHQIPFEHKFRKTNSMACEFAKNSTVSQHQKQNYQILQKLQANPLVKTSSVGNWLIAQYPQKRVKEYYKCSKYQKISCKFMHLSIVSTNTPISAYQLIEEEKAKKEYLHEAISYQISNQTIIEVSLISGNPKNTTVQGKDNESSYDKESENLEVSSLLCKIKYPPGVQYEVGEFELRQDKLYVVLPHMKQIRVYQALLSFEQDMKCHEFGSINASSFKHPTIYFTPQHIDFNKQSLNIPYIVPSSSVSTKHNFRLTSESIQQVFISQWNQILVVRLTIGVSSITRIEFLKSIIADRLKETADASLMVTLPYVLAIDQQQKIIAQYYFTHTFDAYFIRILDFWPDNSTYMTNIRLVDSNTLAVMTAPDAQNETHVQIYILNSVVSSFKQFAKWRVSSSFNVMSFVEDEYQFVTATFEQTTTSLQMYCNSTTLTPAPFLLIDVPKKTKSDQASKQQFYLRLSTDAQSKRHIMTLQVASDSSDIFKGEEYPYKTLRLRLEQDQQQLYVQINDSKWFKGNIWNQRYVCNDCKTGRIRFQDKITLESRIQLQTFNIPNDFYVHQRNANDGLGQYSFETIEGYLHTKLTPQNQNNTWLSDFMPSQLTTQASNNISYTFSQSMILSSNTQNDPSCIKASPSGHDMYFASLCDDYQFLDDSAFLELRLYSNDGFKPFVINEYLIQLRLIQSSPNRIKAGTKSSKQLIILSPPESAEQDSSSKYDTLFVRFDDNIWVFLIVNGKLELIYTVDKVDFGGDHLCWMEVVEKYVNVEVNKTVLQYGIVASMCETGLYYIVFAVDPPKYGLGTEKQPLPSFHRLSEQHIDMQVQLQKNKIQLPQHSYFLQTIVKPIKDQPRSFLLYTIVQNFNSFIWKITLLRETIAISGMELVGVIRRYNEYSPIQVTSNDERYFSVLYKSTQNVNVSQFLAVYDTSHFVLNQEKDIKEYNMFSVQVTNTEPVYQNKSEVFQIGTNLFLLSQNQIKIFNVTNLIRMHVQKRIPQKQNTTQHIDEKNEEISLTEKKLIQNQLQIQTRLFSDNEDPVLYSQSIIIFVETPTQVNSVTIKLDSIDFFELSDWQIAFIVLSSLIAFVILYYVSKQLWKFIQKRRKLVKLQTDMMDDHSSERVSQDRHSSQGKFDEDNENNSQQEQPSRNIHGRDTLITTSDSHSILQRKGIQESLLHEEE